MAHQDMGMTTTTEQESLGRTKSLWSALWLITPSIQRYQLRGCSLMTSRKYPNPSFNSAIHLTA